MIEKDEENVFQPEDIRLMDNLFGSFLKPMRSRNARLIFLMLYKLKDVGYLTTHDIQNKLRDIGCVLTKKEINGRLNSLCDAKLIIKEDERGKPSIIEYNDKYTFDQWKLSNIGISIGGALPNLVAASLSINELGSFKEISSIKLETLNEESLEEIENLYILSKLLVTLKKEGGQMQFNTLRKKIQITTEKLAVYSWPNSFWSEKPLFEVIKNMPTIKSRLLKVFGYVSETDLTFSLTEEGSKLAEKILLKKQ
jgi:DNA-binding HxlR family transcriptional regulator